MHFFPKCVNFFLIFCEFMHNLPISPKLFVLGLIYPPYQTTNEPILIFIHQFCRTIELTFRRKSNFVGIPTAVFTHRFDYIGDDEKTRCFCRNSNNCPKMGTIDLMPCVGAPVIISLPHFLYGDPNLLASIGSGLDPREKNHEFFINMEMVGKCCRFVL